ncbi:BBE domain-containing protein [Actinoplanes sp. CA-015351]|uniref:FAD-dependent oxidoreductase n=1 Tax=Actinoplanes sp. CA-015351 TaxID=3239897 RepID=UPI003D961FE6
MTAVPRRRLLVGATTTAAVVALPGTALAGGAANAAPPGPAVTVLPGDPRYPELTTGNNQRWTARPDRIVLGSSTAQVVRAVQDAVDERRRLTVRSGGHCYENFVSNPETRVILDLSLLSQVSFDGTAYSIGPGITLLEAYRTLYRRWGVTIPGGSCYSVGAGGHIAGGGYGFLSRRHGLAVDHLYGVEVVTVDAAGRARAVVATRDDSGALGDLWWAHTGGGGGNFGVVTRYLMGPDLPKPPQTVLLHGAGLDWAALDEQRFVRLVTNFGRWHELHSAPGSPAEALSAVLALNHRSAGGSGMLVQVDGTAPGAAALLDGFLTAVLDGVADDPAGYRQPMTAPLGDLGPMTAAAEPARWPWLRATAYVATNTPALTDPTQRADHKSAFLRRSLSPAQARTLYRQLTGGTFANPRAGVVLFSYGGRVNAVAPDATAVAQRDSVLKLLVQSFWAGAADDEANVDWVRRTYRELFAGTGGVPVPGETADGCYVNYPDTDLGDPAWNTSGVGWPTLYYKGNYPRLQRAKARWDPRDVFRHHQSVRLP